MPLPGSLAKQHFRDVSSPGRETRDRATLGARLRLPARPGPVLGGGRSDGHLAPGAGDSRLGFGSVCDAKSFGFVILSNLNKRSL